MKQCPRCTVVMVRERVPYPGIIAPNPNIEAHWKVSGWRCMGCGHRAPDCCGVAAEVTESPADVGADIRVGVTILVGDLARIVGDAALRWAPTGMRVDRVEFQMHAVATGYGSGARDETRLESALVTFKPIEG